MLKSPYLLAVCLNYEIAVDYSYENIALRGRIVKQHEVRAIDTVNKKAPTFRVEAFHKPPLLPQLVLNLYRYICGTLLFFYTKEQRVSGLLRLDNFL